MKTPPVASGGGEGLLAAEAARRLRDRGPNEITGAKPASPLAILAAQFTSPLIWLLLVAAVVAGVLGDWTDAAAIGVIVVLNAVIGFRQQLRAEHAVQALRAMTAPRATVVRDGRAVSIPSAAVVPGDLLLLEAGDIVAADARLREAHALSTNEAALTGESLPADKYTAPVPADAPLAERRDTVFMGTAVSTGSARAEVLATGMATELGRVAHLLATVAETETPLQAQLRRLGRTLLLLCSGIVAVVAILGIVRGVPPLDVFLSAVSLAVAAVPESLPAIVTIALAVGVQRMSARNVLVRNLPAVEALGCTTVICTDKTGTLTQGVMDVRDLWVPGPDPQAEADQHALLAAAAACCDAELAPDGDGGGTGTGDPTELGILRAAAARGVHRGEIEAANPRLAVMPFDSERKRMSVRRRDGRLYVKGAVETIVARSVTGTAGAAEAAQRMGSAGLRVLAVAVGDGEEETALRLLGLLGLADPPRVEAIAAVEAARAAGIRTVMITGDHVTTATAIAREIGIVREGENAAEVVHARATPEDKLALVRAWKTRGQVVAMTGDGVNDAPALREAHVGIAMGRGGTAVTREASDVVLADDNFASIVAGIGEGRAIFDNIRKSLLYLLAGNSGELALMLAAAIAGLPLPLLPLQILWINLITDGPPALALVMDPPAPDLLRRPPRVPGRPMLGGRQWCLLVSVGLVLGATTLTVFVWALGHRTPAEARTMAFTALVSGHLLMALAFRSQTRLLWEIGPLRNRRLVVVVAVSIVLQLGLLLLPAARRIFQLAALPPGAIGLALLAGLAPFAFIELSKLVRRGRRGSMPRSVGGVATNADL